MTSAIRHGADRVDYVPLNVRVVAAIHCDAGMLDFIIENLPANDVVTEDLGKLRDAAKDILWTKESSG